MKHRCAAVRAKRSTKPAIRKKRSPVDYGPVCRLTEESVEAALLQACDAWVADGGILVNGDRAPDIRGTTTPFGALLGCYMPWHTHVSELTGLPDRFVEVFGAAWNFGRQCFYDASKAKESDWPAVEMALRFRERYPTVKVEQPTGYRGPDLIKQPSPQTLARLDRTKEERHQRWVSRMKTGSETRR